MVGSKYPKRDFPLSIDKTPFREWLGLVPRKKGRRLNRTINLSLKYKHLGIVYLDSSKGKMLSLDLRVKVRDLLQIRRNTARMKNFLKNFVGEISYPNSA